MSKDDLFAYWDGLADSDISVHPDDWDVLGRVDHHFELDCLAQPFRGPLKTAPVVLLFLAPGFVASDKNDANSAASRACYVRQRTGNQPLPSKADHESAWKWSSRILKQFDLDYDRVRNAVAFLNIAPYKSKNFHDSSLLAGLPSCRVTLNWAQSILFPQAEAGERVVVCLRSASYWGLGKEWRIGKSLFAPKFTRGGFMLKGRDREAVVAAVKKAVDVTPVPS